MPFVRKFRPARRLWNTTRYVVLGLLSVGGLGSLWWWLANLGPRDVSRRDFSASAVTDPALERLAQEISELEENYRRVAESGIVTEQAERWLAEAVNKQQDLIRMAPAAPIDQTARLRRLETEVAGRRAGRLNPRIEQRERNGREALAAGRADEAQACLQEALDLQREVNVSAAAPGLKNFQRESSLRQQLDTLAAAPMAREVAAAREVARDAVAREAWGAALAALVQARELQLRLNSTYPRTRYADIMGVDRLEREISSLNAGGIAADIGAAEACGDGLVVQGEHLEAARHFAEAQARQVELNQQFPRSRFASAPKVEELEVKKQSAMSAPRWEAARHLDGEIAGLLRQRQVVNAQERVGEAAKSVEEAVRAFPKSLRQDDTLRIKLAYLQRREADLRTLQDDVHAALVPLPGVPERALLRSEVTQTLYQRVMNANPSRNPGRARPVDSVNWGEANEFCLRLGWLLGKSVRLPTLDEFRVAVGDAATGDVWSAESAGQASHETEVSAANENGYRDLLGNVAEWLDTPGETAGTALVAGGSYLNTASVLREVPVSTMTQVERARHLGFRVMVRDDEG